MDRSIALFSLALLVFLAGGILLTPDAVEVVIQPIEFNHLVHTEKASCWECHFLCEKNRDEEGEVDCEDCDDADGPFCGEHLACPDHKLPGLPQVQDCLRCHIDDLLDLNESEQSAEEAAGDTKKRALFDYVEFDDYDDPIIKGVIPWQRVTTLSTSCVYFSHRTHALVAGVECEVCHGQVGSMTVPPTGPEIAMDMNWCLDCHGRNEATTECFSCHR